MSPSSIGTYNQCPLKYKFSRLDKIAEPSTEAQVLGSFVHEVLENLFGMPRDTRTESAARSLAKALWQTKWRDEFLELDADTAENDFRWKAWWCIENYFAMENPTSFDPSGVEAVMDSDIDGVPLYGIIDRWSIEDNKIVVSDYKTGKKPRAQYEWEKKMQITIYSILLRQLTGLEVKRAELLYLKSGQFAKYEITEELETAVRVELRNTWDGVTKSCASGEFETRTGPLCGWCSYKPMCPAWS